MKLHQLPLCLPVTNRQRQRSGLSKLKFFRVLFCLPRSLEVGSYLHWFSGQGFQGQYLCFLAFPGHLQIATEEKEAVHQLPHIAYGKECADRKLEKQEVSLYCSTRDTSQGEGRGH